MTRLLIIIPADILDAVQTAATAAFGDVAKAEFVPAGSPTGAAPATHYWLSGLFTDSEVALVNGMEPTFPTAHVETYDLKVQPNRPFQLLNELNLLLIQKPFP